MNAYVLSVTGIVILYSILTAVVPDGKTSKTIKGIMHLVCILVIVSPILDFFNIGEPPNINGEKFTGNFTESSIQADNAFIQYYSEMRVHQAQEDLAEELADLYAVDTRIIIEWEWGEREAMGYKTDEIYIKCIQVYGLETHADTVRNAVSEYLTKNYCSEVMIE